MTAEIYWHDPSTNTAWTEREIAIRNLNTSGFVRLSPPASLPELDKARMLGYHQIPYVAGYPESYVKEYAAALLESERQAHAAEVERLRGDAERYRWLRHGDNDEKVLRMYGDTDDTIYLPRNEQLDAAIDQAIARGKT